MWFCGKWEDRVGDVDPSLCASVLRDVSGAVSNPNLSRSQPRGFRSGRIPCIRRGGTDVSQCLLVRTLQVTLTR